MAIKITQLSTTGVPGKRYAAFPGLAGAQVIFVDPVAVEIFIETGLGDPDAMITNFLQVGDVGIPLVVQMVNQSTNEPIDISAATELELKFSYPDGTTDDFTAALLTDGIDGKMVYVTEADDLDMAGVYAIQGKVTIGSAVIKSGWVKPFEVFENIPDPVP